MKGDLPRSITMDEVMATHRVVERSQNVFVEFRLAPNVAHNPREGYTVICEVVAASASARDKEGVRVYGSWPTHQNVTLEGVFFRLLYDLDHALDDVVAHRAERAAARLPGL